jgi:hypothetical protein
VKTFLRKMKLSFLAMLCGWIACNIDLWLIWLIELRAHSNGREVLMMMLVYGVATGIVILAACLLVFLPVDLLIPDHSKLRSPQTAAICGFIAGSSVVVVLWVVEVWRHGSTMSSAELLTWKAFLLLSSPGITGMVAAYVRSRDRELSLKTL